MSLLALRGISKQYPGVKALDDVTFTLEAGETHCLIGENGAGKSTLMKILAGAILPDSGEIRIDGVRRRIVDPGVAHALRIGMIHQDFKLVPELTVAENISLGHEPTMRRSFFLDMKEMRRIARDALQRLEEDIDVDIPVQRLTLAQQQVVEIAKALSTDVRILALDEPTASLTQKEVRNLFRVLHRFKENGVGIIYISHRLEEIFQVGDRVTILRDGCVTHSSPVAETSIQEMIRSMVGRDLADEYPGTSERTGEEIFRAEHLCSRSIHDISFSIASGEIVGIAGLVGAGRSELARAIFGADRVTSGRLFLEGREIRHNTPHAAIRNGIAFLTEDRNRYGIIRTMNVRENITLASMENYRAGPFIRAGAEAGTAGKFIRDLGVQPEDTEVSVEQLSGGNRQKVILARWLATRARLFILDEPTAGIDVGAKYEIYVMINQLADRGMGIMVISSDLPELLGISTRIIVMCEGRITGILSGKSATQENVMSYAVPQSGSKSGDR